MTAVTENADQWHVETLLICLVNDIDIETTANQLWLPDRLSCDDTVTLESQYGNSLLCMKVGCRSCKGVDSCRPSTADAVSAVEGDKNRPCKPPTK